MLTVLPRESERERGCKVASLEVCYAHRRANSLHTSVTPERSERSVNSILLATMSLNKLTVHSRVKITIRPPVLLMCSLPLPVNDSEIIRS